MADWAYPQRNEFIDETCRLLKIARRPVPKLGIPKGIDAEGYTVLFRLAGKLSQHPYLDRMTVYFAVRYLTLPRDHLVSDGRAHNLRETGS